MNRRERRHQEKRLRQEQSATGSTGDVSSLLSIAGSHLENGRPKQALAICQRVLSDIPDLPDALYLGALAASQAGRFDLAIRWLDSLIAIDPEDAGLYGNLALCQRQVGDIAAAIATFEKALQRAPENAPLIQNLAVTLEEAGKYEEAANAFRRAAVLVPEPENLHQRGVACYRKAGLVRQALDYARETTALRPENAETIHRIAIDYEEIGELERARSLFRSAIDLDPALADAYRFLVRLLPEALTDADLTRMENMVRDESTPTEDRIPLYFALGEYYDMLGDVGRAFSAWREGNGLMRQSLDYDVAVNEAAFREIRQVFTEDFIASVATGDSDATPIIICGMPRSGTTLVEQILSSHSTVHGAGEIAVLADALKQVTSTTGGGTYPSNVVTWSIAEFRALGECYIRNLRQIAPIATRVTDKTLNNYFFLGLLQIAVPQATIINVRRDPIATGFACYRQLFANKNSFAYSMTEIAKYYRMVDDLMAHWNAVMPGRIYTIQYEALVSNFEEEVARLLRHCGLPWEESCLNFHATNRIVKTASAAQVRRPIYASSVDSWRRYSAYLQPLIGALNEPGIH